VLLVLLDKSLARQTLAHDRVAYQPIVTRRNYALGNILVMLGGAPHLADLQEIRFRFHLDKG